MHNKQAFLKYLLKEQIWLQRLVEPEESHWRASDTTVEMRCTNLWPSVRRCEGPEKKKKAIYFPKIAAGFPGVGRAGAGYS